MSKCKQCGKEQTQYRYIPKKHYFVCVECWEKYLDTLPPIERKVQELLFKDVQHLTDEEN